MTTIAKPIIKEIKDNERALTELENDILPMESDKIQEVIKNFPTVYIHNWLQTGKYEVYVGESNNIFNRTREHYYARVKNGKWQHKLIGKDASLYIIGHEHFNKSLTLDIENRLIHYLMSVDSVKQVHNGKVNPQKKYYPSNEFEIIFSKIWRELHSRNKELFPSESVIKDSAIYKASPLHKLTKGQEEAKARIIDCIEMAMTQDQKQIIFVDGEAGTGKTVLNSSTFYEIFCREEKKGNPDFKCYMVVNHDEQVKVYADVMVYGQNLLDKLGLDADEIINMKICQNEAKYPIEKAKGNSAKYDQL